MMDQSTLAVIGGIVCCLVVSSAVVAYNQRNANGLQLTPAVQARLKPQQARLDALLAGKDMAPQEAVAAVKRAFPGWQVRFGKDLGENENPFTTPTVLLYVNKAGRVNSGMVGSDGQPFFNDA